MRDPLLAAETWDWERPAVVCGALAAVLALSACVGAAVAYGVDRVLRRVLEGP